jgi:hypothetical protein
MRKCLRILGNKSDEVSNEVVEQRLNNIVETSPAVFIEKWVDNKTKETEFLVQDAIAKNVIRKNKNVYKYGTDIIGQSLEGTVSYLDSPANQDLRFAITQETSAK